MPKARGEAFEPALGCQAQLWQVADALCNNIEAAEYCYVVLGLTFPQYSSVACQAKHAEFASKLAEGADLEAPDE